MKLLEMGKDMKLKDSVSNIPRKYVGMFFFKKLCKGEQSFLDKFVEGCFTWGHARVEEKFHKCIFQ